MSPKLKSTITKTPPPTHKRRRTKKLCKHLLEQLEFYFSEANLRHDSFMQEKTGEKGTDYVPISLILSFPLIQEMSVEEKIVLNAVKVSRYLEISEDKRFLRRRFPVPKPPRNLDQSTLYVENLPVDTTIEWLMEVCKKIGAVRHVSLPRFRKNGAIKGYAFIEFSSPEEVGRACRIFKDPPKNFFPNRTKNFLQRMKRQKLIKDEEIKLESLTTSIQVETPELTKSAESSCLNKSIDSAFSFTSLGDEQGRTSSGRKRKRRRSKRMSEDKTTSVLGGFGEVTNLHTPAKKMKSLPMKLTYNEELTLNQEDEVRFESEEQNVIVTKKKRNVGKKVLFQVGNDIDSSDEEEDVISTVKINNKPNILEQNISKNARNEENSDISSNNLKKETNLCQKDVLNNSNNSEIQEQMSKRRKVFEKLEINHKAEDINGIIISKSKEMDVKTNSQTDTNISFDQTPTTVERNLTLEDNLKSHRNSTEEKTQDFKGEKHDLEKKLLKRKRCISEPPDLSNCISPTRAKKYKNEIMCPITENQKADAHAHQPMSNSLTSFDINEIISKGRQEAEKSIRKNVTCPDFSRRLLQSVVAKPEVKKRKKTRRRSHTAVEKRKSRVKQAAPKLNVMSKVDWMELKVEYKGIQKENMSRLKQTMKESKSAGSVFIKKHLDALSKHSSSSSDESNSDTESSEGKRKKKIDKRGPPKFTSGVIVRITALETTGADEKNPKLPNIEEIKTRLNKYGHGVAYVDTKEGEDCGFVRFNDGDSAQRAIMEEKSLALCLLTGELEERYWDKLLVSRAGKFARERPKIRGRTKILARAEKIAEKEKRRHIRFDHDFVA